jgi:hypothetical protein
MPNAPAASCALGIGKKHTSNNEYTGITRRSRTQWFYGLFRALPGDRALLPPSPADMFCLSPVGPTQLRELDASIGASGPHDFAVRCNISRPRAVDRSRIQRTRPAIPSRAKRCRVHRIPPRVRDDRDTPLEWDETMSDIGVIWGRRKQQYFCLWDSTAPITPNLARRAGDFFTRRHPPSRRHRKIRHVGQISA